MSMPPKTVSGGIDDGQHPFVDQDQPDDIIGQGQGQMKGGSAGTRAVLTGNSGDFLGPLWPSAALSILSGSVRCVTTAPPMGESLNDKTRNGHALPKA